MQIEELEMINFSDTENLSKLYSVLFTTSFQLEYSNFFNYLAGVDYCCAKFKTGERYTLII